MTEGEAVQPDEVIAEKWSEISAAVDRLAERIADPDDFVVLPDSALAGDDHACHPFEVSQAVRHLINASVDQLHGAKTLLHVVQIQHLAVGATLARAALENTATAMWILGPTRRDERIERVLRWHARNYTDEASTMGHLAAEEPARHIDLIRTVAESRGIPAEVAASGYKVTTPINGAAPYTGMQVKFLWSVASGFAHGRPWAYQGLLQRETLPVDGHHGVRRLTPRNDFSLWLPLEAVHLLGELIRMRDRAAGMQMPPMPDGSPDRPYRPRSARQT